MTAAYILATILFVCFAVKSWIAYKEKETNEVKINHIVKRKSISAGESMFIVCNSYDIYNIKNEKCKNIRKCLTKSTKYCKLVYVEIKTM